MKGMKKRFLAFFMVMLMIISTILSNATQITANANTLGVSILESDGWFESAYVKWASVSGATEYRVSVKKAGGSFTQIDDMLVRQYNGYWRADAVGLSEGDYIIKVEAKVDGTFIAAETEVSVYAFDRTGFAWVNTTSSGDANGAYNSDGTLKSNAIVLYVTEETKDTVSLDVVTNDKGATTNATGIQNIVNLFKKGYDSRPLDIRIIGQVTDFAVMEGGDFVISGSGASNRLTCGITIEGIGDDATCDGWGIRLKNISGAEVRNLGFMNCDSSEGDNLGLQQDCDHVWVHNCDMFYGDAGSDADQAKGDGALDCKKSTYVTFSYNHFWDNGKCNLLGLSEGTTDGLYITYHHNWYDHSDSRHPRVRFYSAHVYNNYYDGNAKYGVGSTLGSSVFVEANYFRNCPYPIMTSMQGSDVFSGSTTRDVNNNSTFSKEAGGTIKAFNNIMTGSYTFIPYGEETYVLKGTQTAYNLSGTTSDKDFDAVVVSSANEQLSSAIVSYSGSNTYNNFDTSSSMYQYTADSPEKVPAIVTANAGRINGGDFKWQFDNSVDDELYSVNTALKSALTNYTTNLVSIGGGDTSDPYELKGIVVSPTSKTIVVNGTVQLTTSPSTSLATITGDVTYESLNKNVATVSNTGLVTAISEGETTIVVSAGGFEAVCNITVSPPVAMTGISLSDSNISVDQGEVKTLSVSPLPSNTTETLGNITWQSSDTTVATVSDGKVTGVLPGTATITATYGAFTATCEVTVNKVDVPVGAFLHNFTVSGTSSNVYTFVGNTSDSKGTVTYSGLTLTVCLKMESTTSVTFAAPVAGKLTLVTGTASKKIKVNGTAYTTDTNGVAVVEVSAGQVVVTKGDSINLYLVNFEADQENVSDDEGTEEDPAEDPVDEPSYDNSDYVKIELSEDGLVAGTSYGNESEVYFTVLENMGRKSETSVEDYSYYYQGSTNPQLTNNIPSSGAAFVINAVKPAKVKFVVKNVGKTTDSAKTYFLVDSTGTIISSESMGSGEIKAVPVEFEMDAGDTYYFYVKSSKVMVLEVGYTPASAQTEANTSLGKSDDGNWYYYVDGVVDTSKTGIVGNASGMWYVEEGQICFNYSGVVTDGDTEYVVRNGYMSTGFSGLVKKDDGTWAYAENGVLTYSYTGLAKNDAGWWYITDGVIDFSYVGIGTNATGDYRVVNGLIDFSYDGWFRDSNGLWWYIKGGMVDKSVAGIVKKGDSYYYVEDGQINFNYTGLAENAGITYYVKYGYLDFNFSGVVTVDNVEYTVVKGIVK